jgi:hypothetical protein
MRYVIALLIALLIPTAALAKGECKEEKKKFCAGLEKKELWPCLSKHEAELGESCRSIVKAKVERQERKAMPGDQSAPSAAPSSPSTDTQPQPTYPDDEPE